MTYVVTGSTSFIGIEIVRLLLECGNDVIAVCRASSPFISRLPIDNCLRPVYADMDEYGILDRQIRHADVFINLAWAGTKDPDARDVSEIHKRNIDCTMNAIELARRMGCKVFVEAGSQAEYGVVEGIITEETPCRPFTEYGKAKLKVKELAFDRYAEIGMKYIHFRIFSVFGENDHGRTLVMTCMRKMMTNEPIELSPCTQKWNFLYVRDAARQIMMLCEYAINREDYTCEVFNIASEDTRVLKDFVLAMKLATHSQSRLNFGTLLPEHNVTLNPDISKTRQAIGFIADYSFESGIRNIIKALNNI